MCFTVSFEGKAIKAVKEHLLINKDLRMRGEFNDTFYLVSGFSHPKLPVIKYESEIQNITKELMSLIIQM